MANNRPHSARGHAGYGLPYDQKDEQERWDHDHRALGDGPSSLDAGIVSHEAKPISFLLILN